MSRNGKIIAIIVAAVIVVGGGAYAVFALRNSNSPDPVSLEDVEPKESSTTSAATGEAATALDGQWSVQQGADSFVGYRVREKLAALPTPSDAVGRTSAVTGAMTIEGSRVSAVDIDADMTALKSNEQRRDNRLRTVGLQTDEFPEAKFALVKPIKLPSDVTPGQVVELEADGKLTLHGVTKSVAVPMQARLDGDKLTVVGSEQIIMADYDIEPPSFGGFVEVQPEGTLELQLVFARG